MKRKCSGSGLEPRAGLLETPWTRLFSAFSSKAPEPYAKDTARRPTSFPGPFCRGRNNSRVLDTAPGWTQQQKTHRKGTSRFSRKATQPENGRCISRGAQKDICRAQPMSRDCEENAPRRAAAAPAVPALPETASRWLWPGVLVGVKSSRCKNLTKEARRDHEQTGPSFRERAG